VLKRLSKAEALAKLEQQRAVIPTLTDRKNGNYGKWRRDTAIAIGRIFGDESRHVKDFTSVRYGLMVISSSTTESDHQRAFASGLAAADSVLASMIDEVRDYWDDTPEAAQPDAIALIDGICRRFPLVVRQLRQRYADRPQLEIDDEYDVQDLLRALLALHFDDVRPEEWTPSYAGGSARMDFLVHEHRVVIEVKKTRKGLAAREVGDELLIDIQRYAAHPRCQTLICFVYDPDGRIANARGLERDLSGEHGTINVRTIIVPTGA
jgi:hypothetical protein